MKSNYNERKIMTESPDSVLLESALQTLKMISTAHVFHDGSDKVILASWKTLAEKEVALIELKQREYQRYFVFGEEEDNGE